MHIESTLILFFFVATLISLMYAYIGKYLLDSAKRVRHLIEMDHIFVKNVLPQFKHVWNDIWNYREVSRI